MATYICTTSHTTYAPLSLTTYLCTYLLPYILPSLCIYLPMHLSSTKSCDSSVGIALGYGLDDRVLGFDFRRRVGIFLFTTASRTALGPTQPPIQCIPEDTSLEVKWPGRETDPSPLSSAEVKECVELYLHSSNKPSWRGARLKKSTGTTLLLPTFHPIYFHLYLLNYVPTWNPIYFPSLCLLTYVPTSLPLHLLTLIPTCHPL
jgi:hypothetical protein